MNIILIDVVRGAEITSTLSLREDRDIEIVLTNSNEISNPSNQVQLSQQVSSLSVSSNEIKYDEIKGKKFKSEEIYDQLNRWAAQKKFKLVYLEGVKKVKDGFKRTFGCYKKSCGYKVVLKSDKEGNDYQIYEKITNKYSYHSKSNLSIAHISLDHSLDFEEKSHFNEEIDQELHYLKGRVRSYKDLKNMLNEKFHTSFEVSQVVYRVRKLIEEKLGLPDNDAYEFVQMAEEEAKLNNGYFKSEVDKDSKFVMCFYCSSTMLIYADFFLDIVIIDSTYRRNRFNLILVNILGINNNGRNILLGFGLLSDETKESYDWLFSHAKTAWKNKEPQAIISDDCDSIQYGN